MKVESGKFKVERQAVKMDTTSLPEGLKVKHSGFYAHDMEKSQREIQLDQERQEEELRVRLMERTIRRLQSDEPMQIVTWPDEILTTSAMNMVLPSYQYGAEGNSVREVPPNEFGFANDSPLYDWAKPVGKMIELAKQINANPFGPGCIGLAAPQVGMSIRAIICHVPEDMAKVTMPGVMSHTNDWKIMLNPRIAEVRDKKMRPMVESCLSQPGKRVPVNRPERVVVCYQDERRHRRQVEVFGLLARCVQHEIDHLNGINIGMKPLAPLQGAKNKG